MQVSSMASSINKMIAAKYKEYDSDECLDIRQIKDICNLYKTKSNVIDSISLSEINFSTPNLKKNTRVNKKNQIEILKAPEFMKKYSFFIKILYSCLKMDVELFNTDDDVLTLKNNYHVIKSLEAQKKNLINQHIEVLKLQHKNVFQPVSIDYEKFYKAYITKIKIIDKIIYLLNKIIKSGICENTDNLLSLILPYFYTYTEFIEEYN